MNYFVIHIEKEEDDTNIVLPEVREPSQRRRHQPGRTQMVELYRKLAPPWEIVKIENQATFRRLYHEMVLSHLNPIHVADDLEGMVLLCGEPPILP